MERVAPLRGSASRARGRRSAPRRLGAVVAIALPCIAVPALADEPVPPEPDTNPSVLPPPSTRPKLILVGAAVTAGWYGISYGMSHLWPDSDGAEPLRVPVIGPYQALAKTGCGDREGGCDTLTIVLRTLLTGFAAVGQTGGVLAMIEGAFVPTGIGLPASSPPPRERSSRAQLGAGLELSPAPIAAGTDGVGVGVVGTF